MFGVVWSVRTLRKNKRHIFSSQVKKPWLKSGHKTNELENVLKLLCFHSIYNTFLISTALASTAASELRTDVLLRSASQSQLKNQDTEGSSVAPSYPSLSDLSIADLSSFKSLTAQKLMAGLSFNSIDTLLEVNAAAEARSKLNESTETVDFGII